MVLDAGVLSEMMWRAIWNKREEAHPSQARRMGNIFNQGFTQKQPNWLHRKTSPGMQVITELGDEIVGFLACSA